VFLSGAKDLGTAVPSGVPSTTNLFYSRQGPGSMGVYATAPANRTETFAIPSQNWGSLALEVSHG
jgi:hypothetical protein